MKLSIILAASVTADKFHKKEWEVQDAYFAGDDVVLSDPSIRKRFYNSASLDSTFGPKFQKLSIFGLNFTNLVFRIS